jgi:hypothetical protein
MAVARPSIGDDTMLKLVTQGDCSGLNADQKLQYYKARCDAAGLDTRATPFQFIKLQGKDVLYATKSCTDQLTAVHKLTSHIIEQRTEDGIRIVSVRVRNPDGRELDDIGAVSIKGLQGDALCNGLMKAVTKAKRRATLSFCGLGMLDESELETIPAAALAPVEKPKAVSHKVVAPEPIPEDDNPFDAAWNNDDSDQP